MDFSNLYDVLNQESNVYIFFQGFEYLLFGSQNDGHFRRQAKGFLNEILTM